MNRREFLKTAAVSAAALTVLSRLPGNSVIAAEAPAAGKATGKGPDLVAVRGGEPAAMFQRAIAEYGGMATFVKPGQKVVVKPNIAWDQPPEMGANTNPELVAEIVRQCLAAGASEVDVFDHTCNAWRSCYRNSGIEAAVEKAGGKVHTGDREADYREVERPEALRLKKAKIHRLILDADVFINVPVLKHHGGAKMTAAMKNFMGLVWDRGYMHKNDLPQCIADSVLYRKPDLNVVDAYRVMKNHGPRGVNPADVEVVKTLMLSRDIVAVDTAAARVIGFPLEQVPYLKMGERHRLGTMKLETLDVRRIDA